MFIYLYFKYSFVTLLVLYPVICCLLICQLSHLSEIYAVRLNCQAKKKLEMIFVWFVLLEISGGVSANFFPSNQYMDIVLQRYIKYVGINWNIDPAKLPGLSCEYLICIDSVDMVLKINYYDIKMIGLFKGQRAGDCCLSNTRAYGCHFLDCNLVYPDIKVIFEGEIQCGNWPIETIMAEVSFSPSFGFIEFFSKPLCYPELTELYLNKFGIVSIKLTGTGPLHNKLRNFLQDDLAKRATSAFTKVFYSNYKAAMKTAVAIGASY